MVHARLRSLTENVGYDIRRLIAEAADGLIYLLQEIPRNVISIHKSAASESHPIWLRLVPRRGQSKVHPEGCSRR